MKVKPVYPSVWCVVKVLKFERNQFICKVSDFKGLHKRLNFSPLLLLHLLSQTAEISSFLTIVFNFVESLPRFQIASSVALLQSEAMKHMASFLNVVL